MNSDVTIIQSRFHYTEKAYVPNTSNIVVIIDELIKLMEPYFHKQAPTFRLINDIRFEHPETASTYDKIHICCMDTSWSQIAYQFSHEFCHLLIGNPVPQKMRWFEEAFANFPLCFSWNSWPLFGRKVESSVIPNTRDLLSPTAIIA